MDQRKSFVSKYWDQTDFTDYSAPDIVAWKLARSAIEHENMLVNHRMTWFLSTQAFLFSAFAILLTSNAIKENVGDFFQIPALLLGTIGLLGLYAALSTQDGLRRAYIATQIITDNYNNLLEANNADPIVPNLHLWRRPMIFSQQWLPIVALFVWCVLITGGVALYTPEFRESLKYITIDNVLKFMSYIATLGLGIGIMKLRSLGHSIYRSITPPRQ